MSERNIYSLTQVANNYICFDCKATASQAVSVPNGVFICSRCATQHSNYSPAVSYIRSFAESLEPNELATISAGGNDNFENYLNSYRIQTTGNIPTKYQTVAGRYYREFLRSKALGVPLESTIPTAEEGPVLTGGYTPPSTVHLIQQKATSSFNSFLRYSDNFLDKCVTKMNENHYIQALDQKTAVWVDKLDGAVCTAVNKLSEKLFRQDPREAQIRGPEEV